MILPSRKEPKLTSIMNKSDHILLLMHLNYSFFFFLMFWFSSTERPPDREDEMCHSLFILISFKVPVRALSCLHMPRLLHLHWRTYVPSPHLQSLSLEELYFHKYFLKAFGKFWLFDQIIVMLVYICKLYNLETNQQGLRKNIFQEIWKVLLKAMRTWKSLKYSFLLQ
jgi:hypothetical protein